MTHESKSVENGLDDTSCERRAAELGHIARDRNVSCDRRVVVDDHVCAIRHVSQSV